jgi:hypothetical protein
MLGFLGWLRQNHSLVPFLSLMTESTPAIICMDIALDEDQCSADCWGEWLRWWSTIGLVVGYVVSSVLLYCAYTITVQESSLRNANISTFPCLLWATTSMLHLFWFADGEPSWMAKKENLFVIWRKLFKWGVPVVFYLWLLLPWLTLRVTDSRQLDEFYTIVGCFSAVFLVYPFVLYPCTFAAFLYLKPMTPGKVK